MSAAVLAPCASTSHRWADWRLVDGALVVCGVCHPPADRIAAVSTIDGDPVPAELRASAFTVQSHRSLDRAGPERLGLETVVETIVCSLHGATGCTFCEALS